jgi:hypothetical protein
LAQILGGDVDNGYSPLPTQQRYVPVGLAISRTADWQLRYTVGSNFS